MTNQIDTQWVTVHTAHNLPEAYIVAGRLKSEGIAYFIKPDAFGQIYGVTVGIHSGVEILVDSEDYDRALELLEEEPEAELAE